MRQTLRKRTRKTFTILILLVFLLSTFSTALTVAVRAAETDAETQDMGTDTEEQEEAESQDQTDEGTLEEAEDKAEEESDSQVTGNEDEESNSETETEDIADSNAADTEEAQPEEESNDDSPDDSFTDALGDGSSEEDVSGEMSVEEILKTESLFSNLDTSLLTMMSEQVLLLQAFATEENHGLAEGIRFYKYEIEYNKYDHNVVEYIVIHDTGNSAAGSNAMAHYQYFAGGNRNASAHYFVDSTMVVQIIDDSEGSWHSGVKYKTYATPISNTNSIGIEMCINSDGDYNQAVQNTIDLAAYLLWKYDLPIERLVRHHDANGKTCPLTMSANNWALWHEFVAAVKAKLATYGGHNSSGEAPSGSQPVWYYNNILGHSYLAAETLQQVLLKNNSSISEEAALEIANYYLEIGEIYGVRGDIAFFQAMLETGYLNYGGEADPSYHNFCGLKNADGTDYAAFETVRDGVEAHIQHLYCYASSAPIPSSRTLLDQRFFSSLRLAATTWEELSGKWAVPGYDPNSFSSLSEARDAHCSYGDIIIALYAAAGGEGVQTGTQTDPGQTSYWDNPIYTGAAAGARTWLKIGMTGADVKRRAI